MDQSLWPRPSPAQRRVLAARATALDSDRSLAASLRELAHARARLDRAEWLAAVLRPLDHDVPLYAL